MYFVPEPPQLSHPIVPIPPQPKHACHSCTGCGVYWCSTTTVVVLFPELLLELLLEDEDELDDEATEVFWLGDVTLIFETCCPK